VGRDYFLKTEGDVVVGSVIDSQRKMGPYRRRWIAAVGLKIRKQLLDRKIREKT